MSDRVREIEARVEAATEGPWAFTVVTGITLPSGRITPHRWTLRGATEIVWAVEDFVGEYPMPFHQDSKFIAHAREDVPWLLAELREAREALKVIADGGYGDASVKARAALSEAPRG